MKILYINSSGKLSEKDIPSDGKLYIDYESFIVGFLDDTNPVIPNSDPHGNFTSKENLAMNDRYSMDLLGSFDFHPAGRYLNLQDISFCGLPKGYCRLVYPSNHGET